VLTSNARNGVAEKLLDQSKEKISLTTTLKRQSSLTTPLCCNRTAVPGPTALLYLVLAPPSPDGTL